MVGQAGARARGELSEVAEQPAMEVIPLPTIGRTELIVALVASTTTGAMPPVEAPLTQVEVAAAVIGDT